MPLVVVVDRVSAACSEIVAAAMQDHGRARVVGEKTFGHGTVQSVKSLGVSALKITSARYHRPNGAAMDANPVLPDLPHDGSRPQAYGGEDDAVARIARQSLAMAHNPAPR